MAYGDSFGGLQSAQLAIAGQGASNYFNQLAAIRAQQAQDQQAQQADRSFMLQNRQLTNNEAYNAAQLEDSRRRSMDANAWQNVNYLTGRQDTAFNQDIQQQGLDLNQQALDDRFSLRDEAKADKLEQVKNAGATFSTQLADAVAKRDESLKTFKDLQTELARLGQIGEQYGDFNQNTGQFKPNSKKLDPFNYVVRTNGKLIDLNNQLKQARTDAIQSLHDFNLANRTASAAGFDANADSVTHRRTGLQFKFPSQGLSEQDMVNQGYFAPTPAAPSVAPTAAQTPQASYFNSPSAPAPVAVQPRTFMQDFLGNLGPDYVAPATAPNPNQNVNAILNEARDAVLLGRKDPTIIADKLRKLGINPALIGL